MKKYLIVFLLLLSCTSPSLEGSWTASNMYATSPGSNMKPLDLPFQSLRFFADSVDVDGELAGIVRERISGKDHLIFRFQDTTRYFVIRDLEPNLMILETSSFYQGEKALVSLKR
ncbi:hypothetical protein [uncultured Algoriphagus sp.]|uniref:hypothetical protein n=1 Tax=uncultured Algoriphagus sp. TaxID=417365 RepID=UPI0025975D8B|nr:hypothetical protein [uncultured Algoriphagus sp.]